MYEISSYYVTAIKTIEGFIVEEKGYEIDATSPEDAGHQAMTKFKAENPELDDNMELHVHNVYKKMTVDVSRF